MGDITITAKRDGHSGDNVLYLQSSAPVTYPITSVLQILVEEYRQDYPDDPPTLVGEELLTLTFTIPIGATTSNKENYYETPLEQYIVDTEDHSRWNNKTMNGNKYSLKTGWK